MNLLINTLSEQQIITSYNFARFSDVVFSETLTHSQYEEIQDKEDAEIVFQNKNLIFYLRKKFNLKENHIIFTNTYFVENLFEILRGNRDFTNIKLITHQTDIPISEKLYNKKPDCISQWFSINVNYENPNLIPLPLGLANNYSPKNVMKSDFSRIKDKSNKIDKLYINFQKNTNLREREKLINKFSKFQWTYYDEPNQNIESYLTSLTKFKFTLAPWGNGFDSHRFWEALYAGSIPVTKKHLTYSSAKDLPAILLDDYTSIDIEKLNNICSENTEYKFEKLKMDYWIDLIKKIDTNVIGNNFEKQIENTQIQNYITKYSRNAKLENRFKKIKFRFRQIYKLPKKLFKVIHKKLT
jgi:hypothetical protein